jgi:sterol desaturase/sphingolipid hydroxylase (fatty acid hydroxylase superfamily)
MINCSEDPSPLIGVILLAIIVFWVVFMLFLDSGILCLLFREVNRFKQKIKRKREIRQENKAKINSKNNMINSKNKWLPSWFKTMILIWWLWLIFKYSESFINILLEHLKY